MKQYNEAGQLMQHYLHGNAQQHLHARSYAYNIRGWLTGINSLGSEIWGNQFGMRLYYESLPNEAAAHALKRYNGNIAAMAWTTSGITASQLHSGYAYSYDRLNRQTRAVYYEHDPSGGTEYLLPKDDSRRYSYGEIDGVGTVDNIQYDRNGNIQSLQRTARASGQTVIFDQLAYYYTGNQLLAVDDAIKGQTTLGDFTDNGRRFDGISPEYHYDPNGNVITDENRSLKIGYTEGNNMPAMIIHEGGTIMNRYSFGGQKLGRKFLDANGQLVSDETYYGSLVMEQRDPGRILFEDGYIDLTPGQRPVFNYHLKDHLGNVRIVLQPGGNMYGTVVQSNDYFPFGMAYTHSRAVKYDGDALAFDERAATENITYTKDNRYLYNGKEEQPMPGKWLDYGVRFYDAQLGRWHSVDPLADQRSWVSSFSYCQNDPINRIDPDGMYDDWYISNREGAIDAPVWLPNDAVAANVYGKDGFISLGENLLPEVVITPDGGSTGISYDLPTYVINAKGEYGQKDSQHKDQKEQNPRVLEYHNTTQNPETGKPFTSDEVAWCASFTNWNITKVGLPSNENKFNATATGYNKWNTQYTQLDKPAIGALAVINSSHVTFVIGMDGKNVHGFGGNQSNQVKVSTYFNPSSVKYYLPVGVTPNYNVPTIKYNFNKVKNESTR